MGNYQAHQPEIDHHLSKAAMNRGKQDIHSFTIALSR